MNYKPRCVNSELLNALDPLERLVAEKFLKDGRWILTNPSKTSRDLQMIRP